MGEIGGDTLIRGTYTVRTTITFGDRSATYHEAGHFTELISGPESGAHTSLIVQTGLRGAIRGPGGLIVRDAGSITFEVTFDETGEETEVEVINVKGPHELFDAGDFFCPGGHGGAGYRLRSRPPKPPGHCACSDPAVGRLTR